MLGTAIFDAYAECHLRSLPQSSPYWTSSHRRAECRYAECHGAGCHGTTFGAWRAKEKNGAITSLRRKLV